MIVVAFALAVAFAVAFALVFAFALALAFLACHSRRESAFVVAVAFRTTTKPSS